MSADHGKGLLKNLFAVNSNDFTKAEELQPNFNSSYITDYINSAAVAGLHQIANFSKDTNAPTDLGSGIPSTINRYSLFQFKGAGGNNLQAHDYLDTNDSISRSYGDSLFGGAKNPTATNIIEYFKNAKIAAMNYSYADFLYCKYYGRIPNNHMITIRRFSMPIVDNLYVDSVYDYASKKTVSSNQPDQARAIGYLGEAAGNTLEEILGFDYNFNWEDIESEMQVQQSNANGINNGSPFLGIGTKGFGAGSAISSALTLGSGINTAQAESLEHNAGYDPLKETYPNYVEGPLNVIKNMQIQGRGLEFKHEFKIKLQYDLRAYGKLNPKMAFLDVIANLLVLTYNNAPFWGGANRMLNNGNYGSPVGSRSFLESGDLAGFLKDVVKDIGGLAKSVFGDGKGGVGFDSVLKGIGNVAGDMLGGWLSQNLNTPQASNIIHAFLSGAPVGKWHVTIGNPLNPIACIGNLNLQNTTMKLHGPLGLDDFPTQLDVELSFKPARPRDKAEVESMFNAGHGRLYHTPKGFSDILNNAGLQEKQAPGATGYNKNLENKEGVTGSKSNYDTTQIIHNTVNSEAGQDYKSNLVSANGTAKDYIGNRLTETIGTNQALINNVQRGVTQG